MAFPQDPLDVTIELYYSGAWHDISSDVYHRAMEPIRITRGRPNESQACDPGQMVLELNNRSGKYSPRNPNSALFGLIGRNTPIRAKVTFAAVTYVMFTGEVSSWPSRWDVTGLDVWVPVTAYGILKRLGQQRKPLRSSLYRTMINASGSGIAPHAYWPLEDQVNAKRFASATGGPPGQFYYFSTPPAGLVEPGTYGLIPGSDLAVTMNKQHGHLLLPVPSYTDEGRWVFQVAVGFDDFNAALTLSAYTTNGFTLVVGITPNFDGLGKVGQVDYLLFGNGVSVSGSTTYNSPLYVRAPVSLVIASVDTPGGDDFIVRVFNGAGDVVASLTATNPGVYGALQSVDMFTDDFAVAGFGDAVMGVAHAAVFTDASFDYDDDSLRGARAMSGYDGESAAARFARVTAQGSIPYEIAGAAAVQMGPERVATLMDTLRECEEADQGLICEQRDALGLRLRTNASRYSQIPLTLSYAAGNISPPFEPEPDDFAVANDREVVRRGGSSTRAELTEGPLSTQDPPDGVGRYDDSVTVNLYSDDQVPHLAYWRLHIGTWDAERYPQLTVDLAVAANAGIIPTVAALDSGDAINITNLPSWLPPETAELLIEGYTLILGFFDWRYTFNCSPAGPYNVVARWGFV